jgi:hypothetical protein
MGHPANRAPGFGSGSLGRPTRMNTAQHQPCVVQRSLQNRLQLSVRRYDHILRPVESYGIAWAFVWPTWGSPVNKSNGDRSTATAATLSLFCLQQHLQVRYCLKHLRHHRKFLHLDRILRSDDNSAAYLHAPSDARVNPTVSNQRTWHDPAKAGEACRRVSRGCSNEGESYDERSTCSTLTSNSGYRDRNGRGIDTFHWSYS